VLEALSASYRTSTDPIIARGVLETGLVLPWKLTMFIFVMRASNDLDDP
jgi:hypothetical protein